jgi:hypothetical protein
VFTERPKVLPVSMFNVFGFTVKVIDVAVAIVPSSDIGSSENIDVCAGI